MRRERLLPGFILRVCRRICVRASLESEIPRGARSRRDERSAARPAASPSPLREGRRWREMAQRPTSQEPLRILGERSRTAKVGRGRRPSRAKDFAYGRVDAAAGRAAHRSRQSHLFSPALNLQASKGKSNRRDVKQTLCAPGSPRCNAPSTPTALRRATDDRKSLPATARRNASRQKLSTI